MESQNLPVYCQACGIHLSGESFVDVAKTVIWDGFCADCQILENRRNDATAVISEKENNSEKPLDIKPF